ncbi:hypothetical protein Tco_1017779 [Tanacetum coccineum]|uniref:Uncharacterized protein n=1 Tax=Tanacetum coccineum TaxID=301880 RepID=A0ABQ5FSX6_9ASTR
MVSSEIDNIYESLKNLSFYNDTSVNEVRAEVSNVLQKHAIWRVRYSDSNPFFTLRKTCRLKTVVHPGQQNHGNLKGDQIAWMMLWFAPANGILRLANAIFVKLDVTSKDGKLFKLYMMYSDETTKKHILNLGSIQRNT